MTDTLEERRKRIEAAAVDLLHDVDSMSPDDIALWLGGFLHHTEDALAQSEARIAELEIHVGHCSQCGQLFSESACGPTHALISHAQHNVTQAIAEAHESRALADSREARIAKLEDENARLREFQRTALLGDRTADLEAKVKAAEEETLDIMEPLVGYLLEHHADRYGGNHCVDVAIDLLRENAARLAAVRALCDDAEMFRVHGSYARMVRVNPLRAALDGTDRG